MCDYSLHLLRSRPAKVGDKLTISDFGIPYGSRGFAAPEDNLAVCLLPGTELSFADEVRRESSWPWSVKIKHKTAIFRQINKKRPAVHHDALEFPDGQIVLLTFLKKGQQATVLQLPASAGVSHPLSADEPGAAVSRRERLPGQISAISR
jgi:hypothetical protein